MTVKEITLLSNEEYEKYKSSIPLVEDWWWWLRSPGDIQDRAAVVHSEGTLYEFGFVVDSRFGGVRPALRLNLDASDSLFWYKPERLIDTKIEYGKYKWTVLNAEFGELYVLCDDIIEFRTFDSYSSDWDTSELKQWLKTEALKIITI